MTVFRRLRRGLAILVAVALPALAAHPQPSVATPAAPASPPPAAHLAPHVSGPPSAAEAPPPLPAIPARPGARLAPGQPIPPAELEAFVDGVVRQAMARDHIAGITVAVVQSGQVVLKKGYGAASLSPWRPVDPDRTLFRIGSISKTFTWILVMRQVEAGHMRLDAPINLYLPEALHVPDQGFDQPIRVENLMNHTPGFEDRSLGELFERDYGRVRPLETFLRQERPHRVRAPGALVSYSNYGAALAGVAASQAAGKPYEVLVESDITLPLGLAHTTFRERHPPRAGMPAPMSADLAADVADGYRWTPAGFQQRPYEFIEHVAPAGAGSSTAGDMARYMLMMLGGGTLDGVAIYGPTTNQAFSTALPRPAPGVPAWRHGLAEQPLSGGFVGVGHGGATLSFMSDLTLVPDLGLGVFVSTNTETGAGLANTLPDRIVQRFYAGPPGPPPPGSPALADDRAAFQGVYLTDRRAYHGLEGFVMRLIGAAKVSVTGDGHLLLQDSDGVSRWAPDGPPSAGQFIAAGDPSRLVFQMKDGRAQRFFAPWGGIAYQRIGFFQQTGSLLLMTVLAAVAAIATLGGALVRLRRDFRETPSQQRASLLQTSQSVLWLTAMILFGVWSMGTADVAQVMYGWPGPIIILASTCALVAALMAVLSVGLTPFVWRGGRRVDSWTAGRKARFTFTAVEFVAYAVMLGFWGALEPWSG